MDSSMKQPTDRYLNSLIDDGVLEIRTTPLSTWQELNSFTQANQGWRGWAFRGHADWEWDLETTLNRAASVL
jgi:hypothetical protein